MNRNTTGATPSQVGIASLLFFLSGWSALAYEVVWFKRASHLWGSSSLAMAAVVAAFLFGLGCGAWMFGRLADRSASPLRLYGLFELGIAFTAVLIPFEFGWFAQSAASLQLAAEGQPLLLAGVRFGLTFAMLGPPCLLMGGTLPLVIRQFTGPGRSLGRATAWLYATNTLGGAVGAWISGFYLLPSIGIGATGNLAVAANVAVGVGALALARRLGPPPLIVRQAAPLSSSGTGGPGLSAPALLLAAALTGYAALALQMLWTRQIVLVIGGSTYAFTATVTVFVLGLGGGSLLFRFLAPRRESLQAIVTGAALAVVLFTLAGLLAGPVLCEFAGEVRRLRGDATFDALLAAGIGAVYQGGATLGMGVLFPALVALARGGSEHPGRTVGSLYAANTLGALLGASTTSVLLLPELGSFLGFRIALICYILVLLVLFPPLRLPLNRAALAGVLASAVLLLVTWHAPDPRAMNLGRYLIGNQTSTDLLPTATVEFFEEGPTSNVLVLRTPPSPSMAGRPARDTNLTLRVNGKIDAGTGADMLSQLAFSYIPHMLRPDTREVLVIGMGSGTTAGASLLFGADEVVCCEIEPAITEAARLFAPHNHAPHDSERMRVVEDDGRSFVQATQETFDLIVSEPSNPWIAGVGNLYTAEFYAAANRRLKPNGLFAQWVQTYGFTPTEYTLVANTLLSVFPYCVLIRITDADTILIAGHRPILPSTGDALDTAQAIVDGSTDVQRDLAIYFRSTDVRSILLERVLLDETDLRRLIDEYGERLLNTDSNLRLEFDAPRRLFADPRSEARLMHAVHTVSTPRVVQNAFLDWSCGAGQVEALRNIKNRLFAGGYTDHARGIMQLALAFAPEDAELLADDLLFGQYETLLDFEIATTRLRSLSLFESYRLGKSLAQMGRVEEARTVLETLSLEAPDSATCWGSLGAVYAMLGLQAEAREALARAVALDPVSDLTLGLQATLEAELGR